MIHNEKKRVGREKERKKEKEVPTPYDVEQIVHEGITGVALLNGLGVGRDDDVDEAMVVIIPPPEVCFGTAGGFRLFGGVGGAERWCFFIAVAAPLVGTILSAA